MVAGLLCDSGRPPANRRCRRSKSSRSSCQITTSPSRMVPPATTAVAALAISGNLVVRSEPFFDHSRECPFPMATANREPVEFEFVQAIAGQWSGDLFFGPGQLDGHRAAQPCRQRFGQFRCCSGVQGAGFGPDHDRRRPGPQLWKDVGRTNRGCQPQRVELAHGVEPFGQAVQYLVQFQVPQVGLLQFRPSSCGCHGRSFPAP